MKILIAEDDAVSRRLLENFLVKWGYHVLSATDGEEAFQTIKAEDGVSLVLSDWMMPKMDGLELCRRIREEDGRGYIYFILLTGKGEKGDVVQGLEAGADDYLVKPFDRQELRCRVKIGERIINLEQKVLHLANTDALTGLLNRRAFMEKLEKEIHRSRREKGLLSLIMMDIDHFKQVNDRYGHQAGDLVLREVSRLLQGSLRPYDFAGRYGGEEFVFCIPGSAEAGVAEVAERIRQRIGERVFTLPENQGALNVRASFGVSAFKFEKSDHMDALLARADKALYRAKSEGRNRVCRGDAL
jgi:two-component system chemotaxis response regulator CheY